jgi:hypothetical protein
VARWLKGRGEQALTALVITMVGTGLVLLAPAVERQLSAQPSATPSPTPRVSAVPAAVLLPDELQRALDGVMTLANDRTFGTAFLMDAQGDFLTASSLVEGSQALRLIDNTGGSHAVRLMGSDPASGIAMVRAAANGTPIALGNTATVMVGDPLVLLASPKIANLAPSSPATLASAMDSSWHLEVDDLPGNIGGPVIGPDSLVLGILTASRTAVPIGIGKAEIASWQRLAGSAVALAPFPPALQLRGSDTTTEPTSTLSVSAVSPARVSASQETVVRISGAGFTAGPALRVRFMPVAGGSGGFDGRSPTVVSASTLTVKVPANETVQDYVIELINGDGAVVDTRIALTVTP